MLALGREPPQWAGRQDWRLRLKKQTKKTQNQYQTQTCVCLNGKYGTKEARGGHPAWQASGVQQQVGDTHGHRMALRVVKKN